MLLVVGTQMEFGLIICMLLWLIVLNLNLLNFPTNGILNVVISMCGRSARRGLLNLRHYPSPNYRRNFVRRIVESWWVRAGSVLRYNWGFCYDCSVYERMLIAARNDSRRLFSDADFKPIVAGKREKKLWTCLAILLLSVEKIGQTFFYNIVVGKSLFD